MIALFKSVFVFVLLAAAPAGASEKAASILGRALDAHGGLSPFEAAGGAVVSATGTLDLAVMMQGRRPDRPEPTPVKEVVAIDLAEDRTAHDFDWFNYKFSHQRLFELYDAEGRVLYVDRTNGNAAYPPFSAATDAKRRYQRFLPNFLLSEAAQRGAFLVTPDPAAFAGRPAHMLAFDTRAGERLSLYIDTETHLLLGAATPLDMELLGATVIEWRWSEYRTEGELRLPGRLQTRVSGELLRDVALETRLGASPDMFALPAGLDPGAPPADATPADELVPYAERAGAAREIAEGIWLVPNLRPGFHMMFVEFEDFLLAVDAPAGWYEMEQIPPHQFARGETISALSAKYLRIMRAAVPGKPVRYAVLTHHHSDHIGGFRAFARAGSTLLTGAPTAAAVRRAYANDSSDAPPPIIETVTGSRDITDGEQTVRLIELPAGNPKAEGMLVVYLPARKILYATGFLYPVPENVFPIRESLPLSLWFVDWLDKSGLEVERMYNVHGQARVQDWQLERLRAIASAGESEPAGS